MEATKKISELKQYLDKFKKAMSEIEVGHLEEIPKFHIPNWPKELGTTRIVLRRPTLLCPRAGKESQLLNLSKRFFVKVVVMIYEKGRIHTELFLFGQSPDYYSDSDQPMNRTMCFIVFNQLLDPLCDKIIKKLNKKYSRHNKEAEEYNRICVAVKKSFEPLIPFVVADILNKEEC